MSHRRLALVITCVCATAASCSNRATDSRSADPFVGFFAHPSSGLLELKRGDAEGKYRGSMWADFGPFPVEVTRHGSVARGTVTWGGAAHPLVVESTPEGLVLTAAGTRAEAPLRRYKSRKAYLASTGGYQGELELTTQPAQE